jgi:hypothetical protein
MAGLTRQVAIVSDVNSIQSAEVSKVSAAIQKQVTRDFAPIWEINATVDAFASLEDIPVGYWPVIIRQNIGAPGAGGFHQDTNGQPFALVQASPDWSITASHETLEMLADPFGNRTMPGDSPKPDQGRVEFLVEVCDPSEAPDFGYTVNGILVSDFYTPHFFDPIQASGVRYSFTGAITEPRQVLRDGYLSWHDPVSNHWWQLQFFGGQRKFIDLGVLSAANGSIRSQIDRRTDPLSAAVFSAATSALTAARSAGELNDQSSAMRAKALRVQIEAIVSRTTEESQADRSGVRRVKRVRGGD